MGSIKTCTRLLFASYVPLGSFTFTLSYPGNAPGSLKIITETGLPIGGSPLISCSIDKILHFPLLSASVILATRMNIGENPPRGDIDSNRNLTGNVTLPQNIFFYFKYNLKGGFRGYEHDKYIYSSFLYFLSPSQHFSWHEI